MKEKAAYENDLIEKSIAENLLCIDPSLSA